MRALEPELDETPSALPDTSIAVLQGVRVEQFGVSFQLPWHYTDKVISRPKWLITSGEGGTITFEDPSSDPWTPHMIREFAKSIPDLSLDARSSICGLQRVAMGAKTEQVKWWKIPSQNRRARGLLFLKVITEPPMLGREPLYTVNINGLCGFQRGNPLVDPYLVSIDLFDNADRHYKMTIISQGKTPAFSQAEINAIVASIHPTSTH